MFWYILRLLPIFALTLIDGTQIQAAIEAGGIQKYTISKDFLSSNSKYEVRISHLGTTGSAFQLNWGCAGASSRRLLDTEKLIFFTDANKKITGGCDIFLVQASRNSRAINAEAKEKPIWYNLKIDKYDDLLQLPESVIPVIFGVIASIFLALIAYKFMTSPLAFANDKNI